MSHSVAIRTNSRHFSASATSKLLLKTNGHFRGEYIHGGKDRKERVGVEAKAFCGAVSCDARSGNGASFYRQVLENEGCGNLSLCLLRGATVRFLHKIRLRNRLAKLFQTRGRRQGGRSEERRVGK